MIRSARTRRVAARRFGQGHGQIGGEIPMLGVAGPLDQAYRFDFRWQGAFLLEGGDGSVQQAFKAILHGRCDRRRDGKAFYYP
jgi:hypothetical protein